MKKFTLSAFIMFSFILSPAANANFIDVVPQSVFFEAVQYFSYDFPIISLENENFRPLTSVTKAEFYKLILAGAGFEAPTGKIEGITCIDVSGEEWFAPYVKKSLELGLFKCDESDNTFNPGDYITRAQGMESVFKLFKLPSLEPGTGSGIYYDVQNTASYSGIAQTAYELRLLNDYKSGMFLPDKLLTRAETVYILYGVHSFIDYLPDLGSTWTSGMEQTYGSTELTNLDTYNTFVSVWNKITNEYVEKNALNKEELLYGAIEGMVEKIGDPYTVFFEPTDSVSFQESLDGSFEGIGIYLNETEDGKLEIVTPLKGSPAEAAGIKPGDIITAVDGINAAEVDMEELILMLRGPAGSKVTLKILRGTSTFTVSLTRAQITVPYVESEIINNVGVIHYYQFTANSHDQFVTEIKKITDQNPEGLILDMRNNPGGYLYSSQDLLSHFLAENTVFMKMTFADGTSETQVSNGPAELKDYPLVVLMNEGSASASEIVALALKDLNKTKIVGATSYGKGKIQEIIYYDDNSSLKISTAKWYSPLGSYIDKVGIAPDYKIVLSDADSANNRDPQMDKAIEIIKSL